MIVSPPYYLVGIVLLAVGLFVLIVGFSGNSKDAVNTKWIGIFAAAPFLLAGGGIATARKVIVLSREDRSVRVETSLYGFRVNNQSESLAGLRQAFVESNARRGEALSIRRQDGSSLRLAGASTQGGYGEAAQAINDFLRARPE